MCERCDQARVILQECANRQGHNKCWWNPEVLQSLMTLFDIQSTVEPCLPPKEEFNQQCGVYADKLYGVDNAKRRPDGS